MNSGSCVHSIGDKMPSEKVKPFNDEAFFELAEFFKIFGDPARTCSPCGISPLTINFSGSMGVVIRVSASMVSSFLGML